MACHVISELTRGLPLPQRWLLVAILAKCDENSRISGQVVRHSYQALREALEIEGARGRARQSYSKNQIRHFVAMLEKRGLITHQGDLVFKVHVEPGDYSVQMRSNTTHNTTSNTPGIRKNGSALRLSGGNDNYLQHDLQHDLQHTSDDDDDIGGAVTHPTDTPQGGSENLPFAAFFRSEGFTRRQITDAAPTLWDWSAKGATPELVQRVIGKVNDRLEQKGNEKPWSPKYYDREIKWEINRAGNNRSDARPGASAGDEIDAAIGGQVH